MPEDASFRTTVVSQLVSLQWNKHVWVLHCLAAKMHKQLLRRQNWPCRTKSSASKRSNISYHCTRWSEIEMKYCGKSEVVEKTKLFCEMFAMINWHVKCHPCGLNGIFSNSQLALASRARAIQGWIRDIHGMPWNSMPRSIVKGSSGAQCFAIFTCSMFPLKSDWFSSLSISVTQGMSTFLFEHQKAHCG